MENLEKNLGLSQVHNSITGASFYSRQHFLLFNEIIQVLLFHRVIERCQSSLSELSFKQLKISSNLNSYTEALLAMGFYLKTIGIDNEPLNPTFNLI